MENLPSTDQLYILAVVDQLAANPDVPLLPLVRLLIEELNLKVGTRVVERKLKELIGGKA